MKPEMIEGQEAKGNFERTMKKLFRVSKTEIIEAINSGNDLKLGRLYTWFTRLKNVSFNFKWLQYKLRKHVLYAMAIPRKWGRSLALFLVLVSGIFNAVLLLLRELKDSVNSVYRFFWCHHILAKICLPSICICAIFFPCFIERNSVAFSEEKPEFLNRQIMFIEGRVKDDGNFRRSFPGEMLELKNFGGKGISQSTSSKSPEMDVGKLQGKPKSNPSSHEGTDSGCPNSDKRYLVHTRLQFYLYAALGCFIGLVISVISLLLFFKFKEGGLNASSE